MQDEERSSASPGTDSSDDEVCGKQTRLRGCDDKLEAEDDEGYVEYKWKLVKVAKERLQHLITQMKYRVMEGNGECLYEIGVDDSGHPKGLEEDEYQESIRTIRTMADHLSCEVTILCEKIVNTSPEMTCCELLIRKINPSSSLDLRIAVCGNVDSGKSTLTGVLTTGELDNGRGSVRQAVFCHKHEVETGRTSAISRQTLGFDAQGIVQNYTTEGVPHIYTTSQIAEKSSKIVTLFDLAGHERYLKTTVFGMTGYAPDYAAVVVSANNGVQRMTKEHLGLCFAVKIPVFGVITRIDNCPEEVFKNTLATFKSLFRQTGSKKIPYVVKTPEDVLISVKNIQDDKVAPIFCVSNVTGEGLDLLRRFMNLLPSKKDWSAAASENFECLIDKTYSVSGVGTVVSGVVTKGKISTGDHILIGPDYRGGFKSVPLKGIHIRGCPVREVAAGTHASFALKKEKRCSIRKGSVILGKLHPPAITACTSFEASIVILFHSTTIKNNYQPVVHCRTIRQSARVHLEEDEHLRTGEKSTVKFTFAFRPEYLTPGLRLVFRDGSMKGLGTVTKVFPL
eukprot:TRINITY_DN3323_c3_g1_i1.p1 TRINITY_DN3323_c3_g1~~TRINITY_DN3323_c3_g1_i1.p1  ORF type:complete len:587 (+),score=85.97 TRINITY_DN3323_c3_g1_i1:64-1761(+)